MENPLEKNCTDVRIETESIAPTRRENSEERKGNFVEWRTNKCLLAFKDEL